MWCKETWLLFSECHVLGNNKTERKGSDALAEINTLCVSVKVDHRDFVTTTVYSNGLRVEGVLQRLLPSRLSCFRELLTSTSSTR